MNGGLDVLVEGSTVVRLVATPPLAAKVLPGPTLMVVGSAAGLLAGDTIRIRISLAPGASLTVRTTAATIAHPCPDGGSTALEIDCRLGQGAQLVWLPEPLIACAGCRHTGRTRLSLGCDSVVTWLETVALGRTGESPGWLEQRLDASVEGRPLLREGLRIGPGWDGPAVLGPHRHLATLHLLGRRLPLDLPGVMQLAGPGTTARFVARRGDELSRQIETLLPLFAHLPGSPGPPGPPGDRAKEAVHV